MCQETLKYTPKGSTKDIFWVFISHMRQSFSTFVKKYTHADTWVNICNIWTKSYCAKRREKPNNLYVCHRKFVFHACTHLTTYFSTKISFFYPLQWCVKKRQRMRQNFWWTLIIFLQWLGSIHVNLHFTSVLHLSVTLRVCGCHQVEINKWRFSSFQRQKFCLKWDWFDRFIVE